VQSVPNISVIFINKPLMGIGAQLVSFGEMSGALLVGNFPVGE